MGVYILTMLRQAQFSKFLVCVNSNRGSEIGVLIHGYRSDQTVASAYERFIHAYN